LFIAIKGNRFDGHDFIEDAVLSGAAAIVINNARLKQFNNVNVPLLLLRIPNLL